MTVYSGSELQKYVFEFLKKNVQLREQLKIYSKTNENGRILIIRCNLLQELINILKNHALVAEHSMQHNIIRDFLQFVLNYADELTTEVSGEDRKRFDIDLLNIKYEIKSKTRLQKEDFSNFIREHRKSIIEELDIKDIWWFVTFYEIQPNSIYTCDCSTYMIIMELNAKESRLRKEKKKNRVKKMKEIEEKMGEETKNAISDVEFQDFEDEGILVPVKNILIVETLRKDNREKDAKIKELIRENEELKEKLRKR